jgi:hypothetical protein
MVEKQWTFKSKERGYALWYGKDLTGDQVLIRRWWGLSNGCGGQSTMLVNDENSLQNELRAESARRIKHGYKLVEELNWLTKH